MHWQDVRAGVADDVPRIHSDRPARVESSAIDAVLRDPVATRLQWICVMERLVGKPDNISISIDSPSLAFIHTLPSAHSIISSTGKLARYMAVVLHHIGKPTNTIMAQNEAITYTRRRILSGDSGGGSFLLDAMLTAYAGASSLGAALLSTSFPSASEVMGDAIAADMAMLLSLSHLARQNKIASLA